MEKRILRHVSSAFCEDPLRVLRVARFFACFNNLGFQIATPTKELLEQVVTSDELSYLTPERVWQETDKALATESPWLFFQLLRDVGALAILFPEIDNLFGVPQTEKYHPEIDTGTHTLMALEIATRLTQEPELRFATLVHDLGKAETKSELLPKHHGHEERGVPLIQSICARFAIPNRYRDIAILVSKYHLHCHRAKELKPRTLHKLLTGIDVWRKPERLSQFLICCEADARGRLGMHDSAYPSADYIRAAYSAVSAIDLSGFAAEHTGRAIGEAIAQARIEALTEFKKNYV